MKRKTLKILTIFLLISVILRIDVITGQDTDADDLEELRQEVERQKPGETTFLMRGYAHAGFEVIDEKSSFVSGTFAPIFLWRQSDRILFEAEAEITYAEEGSSFALEYANLSYVLNDYLIARFGNFLTPFGIFGERLHPNWINRFSTNPLGFNHHNPVGPFAEFGVEVRGGAALGSARTNYAAYLSNGPVLQVDTSIDPLVAGTSYRNIRDNNNNKAIGGRIGILPFSNSALELGFSGQYAKLGDRDSEFEEISSRMYALDLTLVKNSIAAIKGSIDLKGQWNYVDEDKFQIIDSEDGKTDIDNDKSAYFAMFSYRPNLSASQFLSNLELVVRYSALNIIHENSFVASDVDDGHDDHTHKIKPKSRFSDELPGNEANVTGTLIMSSMASPDDSHDDEGEVIDETQWAFGLNYWLTWRSVIKMSYQVTSNESEIPGFYVHYALGF